MGILARLRLAKIQTMARPNSPDMPPKRTKKVRLGISSCESGLKRTQNEVVLGSEAADGMWYNNNESNCWESDHSTYFALHFILFEHLELLEHRATSTAGKTMLFCVVYSRKNFVLSGNCQCSGMYRSK